MRRWGTMTSGCWKEGNRAEGSKGRQKARVGKGTELRAEKRGKIGRLRTVPGRGTAGGRGRGEAQGGRGAQGTGEGRKTRSSR